MRVCFYHWKEEGLALITTAWNEQFLRTVCTSFSSSSFKIQWGWMWIYSNGKFKIPWENFEFEVSKLPETFTVDIFHSNAKKKLGKSNTCHVVQKFYFFTKMHQPAKKSFDEKWLIKKIYLLTIEQITRSNSFDISCLQICRNFFSFVFALGMSQER